MTESELPKTVFRYRPPTKYAFAELATNSIWMSSIEDFNDPFEFQFKVGDFIDTPENRQFAAEILRKGFPQEFAGEIEERMKSQDWNEMKESAIGSGEYLKGLLPSSGVCCFSGVMDSYLMWGHYAAGHTGFLIEYRTDSFPLSEILPVRYSEQLHVVDYKKMTSGLPAMYDEIMTHKGHHWAYEKEYRLIHKGRDNRVSLSIEPDAIKAIYFGARCERADRSTIGRLVADLDVEIYEAKLLTDRYGIEFARLQYIAERTSPAAQLETSSDPES